MKLLNCIDRMNRLSDVALVTDKNKKDNQMKQDNQNMEENSKWK